jgi:L-ascorbate metabolism protein UlaG (beta-lactamase superfamily)
MIEYADKVIYIDPYEGEYDKAANLVLFTKDSYDHFSRDVLKKISVDGTHVFGPKEVAHDLLGCRPFVPGENITFEDNTKLQAIEAIINRRNLHAESLGWLLTIEKKTLYFTGDTDIVPANLHPDVVIIPVGGTFTMGAKAAAEAVKFMKPKHAIPTHYGKTAGTVDDADVFKELLEGDVDVMILTPGRGVPL